MAHGRDAGDRRAVGVLGDQEALGIGGVERLRVGEAGIPALARGPLDREVDLAALHRADAGLSGHAAQYPRADTPARPRRRPAPGALTRPLRPDDAWAATRVSHPQPPMEERPAITRRAVLKGAVGLATLGAAAGTARIAGATSPRDRVAIVGAGAGGIAAAYFLAGAYDVELFEARGRIGGHCDRGRSSTRATGSPSTSARSSSIPTRTRSTSRCWRSWASTTQGIPRPTRRASHRAACASSRWAAGRRSSPRRTRSRPCRSRSTSGSSPSSRGRRCSPACRGGPVSTPGSAASPCSSASRTRSCTRGSRRRSGRRGQRQCGRRPARSCRRSRWRFPADLARPATTFTSRIGLQGNLQRLLDRSPGVEVHLRAPARALERKRGRWSVRTPHGRRGPSATCSSTRRRAPGASCSPAPRVRRGDGAARQVPVPRLAPADPRRPGVRAPRPRQLVGLQRGRRQPRVRGERLARRVARAAPLGRDGRRLQVVGHAPRRRPRGDPAGRADAGPAGPALASLDARLVARGRGGISYDL